MGRRAAVGAGTALGASALFAPAAEAAPFEVTNTANDGTGSLRDAIEQANANGEDDVITFQATVTGTIELDDSLPIDSDGLEIHGPRADQVTVDANGLDRVFYASAFEAAGESVSISGLTLTGGDTAGRGGAVYAGPAGGEAPDLTVSGLVIAGNHSQSGGGGIWARGGSMTIHASTLAANDAGDVGGGASLYDTSGPVTIAASTFTGNQSGGNGGGLAIWGQDDAVTILNSTISGNTADANGGGVYSNNDRDTERLFANSTIFANSAAEGGGIWALLVDDDAEGEDVLELRSTIVAGNFATDEEPDLGDDDDVPAEDLGLFAFGFSLIERPSDVPAVESPVGSNVLGADPQLGPLAANGGPTLTHLPAPLSPALEAGIAGGLLTDQRGLPRTVDLREIGSPPGSDATDIGAVELAAPEARVNCRGADLVLVAGTSGDDDLAGTDAADAIFGLGGDDVINGRGGDDCLNGGGGKDVVRGGRGNDQLKGRGGRDRLKGQAGRDRLRGQGGDDRLDGGAGRDRLAGGAGRDRLRGGPGKDKLKGNAGRDRIVGGGGRDQINCGGGRDVAVAGSKDKVSRNCERVVKAG
ncbi:MAG: choice-of-anchor Q domain-containing protein [Solirubrobacterales bacterium]